ncbi:uncharacterized protein LOC143906809 isoform X2 [Temnothorax americanus]|uniref:uncharacterized protein LOC143906809 isoform X2 n=1 Tax=Temnothorax americanus TaxID=1964332 RepID=UPI004068F83A
MRIFRRRHRNRSGGCKSWLRKNAPATGRQAAAPTVKRNGPTEGRKEAQDIEIEHLDILTEEDLKLLIPHIGPRQKFQSKLKKYLCELPAEEEQQTYVINTNPKKKLRSEIELNKEDATEQQHLNEEAVIEQEHVNEEVTTEQQHVNEEATTEQQHVNEEAATEQNITIITEQEPLHAVITTAQQHSNAVIEPPHFVDLNDDNSYVFEISRSGTPSEYSETLSTNETTKRGVTHHIYSDYNLEAILKKSDDGLLLLRSYTNKGRLDNDLRNKLAKIIVSNELSSNINNNITSNRASFLSDQIIKLFPTEEKSVWYIQHKKGQSQGRGKILTKYYATRRKLIKVGLINLKEDQAEAESDLPK